MFGVLAAILDGAAFGRDHHRLQRRRRPLTKTGQFAVVIDLAFFTPGDWARTGDVGCLQRGSCHRPVVDNDDCESRGRVRVDRR